MAFIGLIIAAGLFFYYMRRLKDYRPRELDGGEPRCPGAVSWHDEWHRQWAEKFERQASRRAEHAARHGERHQRRAERKARRWFGRNGSASPEEQALRRARRRARTEVGFYIHLMSYLGVIAFLAFVNIMTTRYPWFLWPAMGWGIGLFAHYMAVFGGRMIRQHYFEPTLERELRREKIAMNTEKQASIDELSATIAHEIRNPIAAAKSLVQQMGEDPVSVENVEYAKVALDELDRVERRISHLLRFAKEEDYSFDPVSIATVVDNSLTQLKAKLEAAGVRITRNYIGGPKVLADAEKLQQVFTNIIDNATDALTTIAEERRIDLFVENGGKVAKVRIRDNGCGIPADKIERIFNPFFTTKEKGTGLGMAISKKIVEAHEGSIDVVSEAGKGAEFIVALPLPQ